MAPEVPKVVTSLTMPGDTTVVVIGAGIVGLTAALVLAEQGIPVVVLEKGRLAGEQSSRNLGWIRKMGRSTADLPLSLAAQRLWSSMAERVGYDAGYRQAGIMYIARSEAEMANHAAWLSSVRDQQLDSRLVTSKEIDRLVPNGTGSWRGGLYTPSDGRAEPTLAASAIARCAISKGVVIVENCAVRELVREGGRISGVVTEQGEIRCDQVVVAAGMWSRRFLHNAGVSLLTLPVVASVCKTVPMNGPTDIAVGAPDFSFRKALDGGYVITQRGAFQVPLVPDSFRIGHRYLSTLRSQWKNMRLSIGETFKSELALPRRWSRGQTSPFEQVRTLNPPINQELNREALHNMATAWPLFSGAVVQQSWAGMIDVTPDSLPVISSVDKVPGLTIATGFSGHGFGTSPAAGQLVADLVTGGKPIVDPTPYQLSRQSGWCQLH